MSKTKQYVETVIDYLKVKIEEIENDEKEDEIKDAIDVLRKHLSESKEQGSYYYSWQSNIAMSIKDNICGATHEDANKAAKAFLDLLIK